MWHQAWSSSGLLSRVYERAWVARTLAASWLNSSSLQGVFGSSSRLFLYNGQVPEAVASSPGPPCSGERNVQDEGVCREDSLNRNAPRGSDMFNAQTGLGEAAAWAEQERARASAESAHQEQLHNASSQVEDEYVGRDPRSLAKLRERAYEARLETVKQIVNRVVADDKREARAVVDLVLGRWLKGFSASSRGTVATSDTDVETAESQDHRALRKFISYDQVARTANSVVRSLGTMERPGLALEVFRWMQRQGWCQLDPHLFTTLLKIMGDLRQKEVVSGLFTEMRKAESMRLDVHSYNAAVSAFFQCGRFDEGMQIFERMKTGEYGACDVVTYNIVISACGKQGFSLSRLGSLFKEMQAKGLEPDIYTYTTLISICSKRKLVKEAEQFYRVAKKKGLVPNVVTYTALIYAYGRAGFPEAAQKVYEEMKLSGCMPNQETFSTIVCTVMDNSVDSVLAVIQEMHDLGVPTGTAIYNQLIAGYVREDRLEEAGATLVRMRTSNCRPNQMTFSIIMKAYNRLGNHETVLKMYEDLRRDGLKLSVELFTSVLDACTKMGSIPQVCQIMRHMRLARVEPTLVTCVIVLWALAKCNTAEEAASILTGLQSFDSGYNTKICEFITAPSTDDGAQAKEMMLSIFNLFRHHDERSLTIFCGALMDSLWQLGLRRRAALVLAVAMQHLRLFEGGCIFQSDEWTLEVQSHSAGCARVEFYQWLARLATMARQMGPPKRRSFSSSIPPPDTSDKPWVEEGEEVAEMQVEGESSLANGEDASAQLNGERLYKEYLEEDRAEFTAMDEDRGESTSLDMQSVDKVLAEHREPQVLSASSEGYRYEEEGLEPPSSSASERGSEEDEWMPVDRASTSGSFEAALTSGNSEAEEGESVGDRGDWEESDGGGLGRPEGEEWGRESWEEEGFQDEWDGEMEILLPLVPFTAEMDNEGYLETVTRFPKRVVVVTGSGGLKHNKVSNVRAAVESEVHALEVPFQRGSSVPGWRRLVARGPILHAWLRRPDMEDRLRLLDSPTFDFVSEMPNYEGTAASESKEKA